MFCKCKDVNIHYEVYGEGKPIVMLHGFAADYRLMAGCMEPAFKGINGYKRIYFDLPGMGLTTHADGVTSADRMLDIAEAFIKTVIPGERFLLAAESYGGYLARGILYRMGERADGLLLLCPVILANSNSRQLPPPTILQKDEHYLSGLSQKEAKKLSGLTVIQTGPMLDRCRAEVLSGLERADLAVLKKIKENYAFSFDVDAADKAVFNKPTLFLLGRQDSRAGYKDAWTILENYPRATFAVLDAAGHNLQIEQPELFNSLVREWVLRTEIYG